MKLFWVLVQKLSYYFYRLIASCTKRRAYREFTWPPPFLLPLRPVPDLPREIIIKDTFDVPDAKSFSFSTSVAGSSYLTEMQWVVCRRFAIIPMGD